MDLVMETIDEQIIKPILKHRASLSGQFGFLGEMKALTSRPPTAPKKHVCIHEENNEVGLTYSSWEYDRTKLEPSTSTIQLIKVQNALRQQPVWGRSNPVPIEAGPTNAQYQEMDLVLTEQSFSRAQWDFIGSAASSSPTSEFRVGEWADMFLSMGHTM